MVITYHTHSNLWNVLIIGMQVISFMERINFQKKLTILIVRTGKFYSVYFSCIMSLTHALLLLLCTWVQG